MNITECDAVETSLECKNDHWKDLSSFQFKLAGLSYQRRWGIWEVFSSINIRLSSSIACLGLLLDQ